MSGQRTIAVIMIVVSSVLTAWASADIAFPAILCMLALLGTEGRFTWDIRPERRFITPLLLLLLAILFAVHCHYANIRSDEAATFAWGTIARYFLSSMTLLLFLRPPARLPPSLGLFHLANAMAAGQALLLEDVYLGFRFAELLGVTLVLLYAVAELGGLRQRPPTRPRSRLRAQASRIMLLAIALNVGWLGGSLLYRHVELFHIVPGWVFRSGITLEAMTDGLSRVGFSGSGRLSSLLTILAEEDPTPVLRIESETSPGYLRARAFEVYRQSQWHDLSYRDAMYPQQNPFGTYLVARMNLFRLNTRETARTLTIRHQLLLGETMFSPLGTSTVEAPFSLLMRDDDEVIGAPNTRSNLIYRVTATASVPGPRPTDVHLRRMRNIPVQLDPRIEDLAAKTFAGCRTVRQKIQAVVGHFHAKYTYVLGLDVPPGRDHLEYFLLEADTGYCEYFASGAAILLRFAGVPTRYVTGFLATERADDGQAWVARNMDAHAWVEAWDDDRNEWTIVEATVREDLAAGSLAQQPADKDGGGGLFLRRLARSLYDYGLFGFLAWFFESYSVGTGIAISLAFAGGALWLVLFRRYRRSRRRVARRRGQKPECAALHAMLATMDRRVKSAGLTRRFGETLHAFSHRLRTEPPTRGPWSEVADWYLAYATLRYGAVIAPGRLLEMQSRALQLRGKLAKR